MELETLGSDLEVFLKKKGSIISAENKVGGTKEEPLDLENGVSVQEDNVMAEFNVNPATSKEEFLGNVNNALFQLRSHVSPLELDLSASYKFPDKYLNTEQAMEFACDPDESAWGLTEGGAPDPDDPLRTCGGHIHLGYLDPEMDEEQARNSRINITKLLDLYIGVPSVIIGDLSDQERVKFYGKPGRFREKEYGLEYRTVSNFWIRSNELIRWIFDAASKAVQDTYQFMIKNPGSVDILEQYDSLRIRGAIENFDRELAEEIADIYNLIIPSQYEDKEKQKVNQ